jgi:hypothetical protein
LHFRERGAALATLIGRARAVPRRISSHLWKMPLKHPLMKPVAG